MDLTPRQKSVLDFVRKYHKQAGIAPTVREICEHMGLKGPAGVHRILGVLIEKGYLQSTPGKKRSWRLVETDDAYAMPVLGAIAAGEPIGILDSVDEHIPVDPMLYGDAGCFALRVKGDSMIGMHIQEGDLAVILPADTADDGDVVAVIVDDVLPEATLKKICRRGNTVALQSANSAYPPLVYTGREQARIRIVGKYVGLIRKL